jgi:hypothetical protein
MRELKMTGFARAAYWYHPFVGASKRGGTVWRSSLLVTYLEHCQQRGKDCSNHDMWALKMTGFSRAICW